MLHYIQVKLSWSISSSKVLCFPPQLHKYSHYVCKQPYECIKGFSARNTKPKNKTITQIWSHHIYIWIFTCQLYGDTGEFTSSVETLKIKMRGIIKFTTSCTLKPSYFKIQKKWTLLKSSFSAALQYFLPTCIRMSQCG